MSASILLTNASFTSINGSTVESVSAAVQAAVASATGSLTTSVSASVDSWTLHSALVFGTTSASASLAESTTLALDDAIAADLRVSVERVALGNVTRSVAPAGGGTRRFRALLQAAGNATFVVPFTVRTTCSHH